MHNAGKKISPGEKADTRSTNRSLCADSFFKAAGTRPDRRDMQIYAEARSVAPNSRLGRQAIIVGFRRGGIEGMHAPLYVH